MQRFFNRKNTIVFSVLLIVCFIAASTLLVLRSGYQAKVEAAATSTSGSSGSSELSDKIVDTLSGLLQSAAAQKDGESAASADAEEEKPVYNAKQLGYLSQAKRCLVFSIILYVLAGLSMGLDVTCAAYDAYRGSDRPKTKKKSKAVAAKRSAAASK